MADDLEDTRQPFLEHLRELRKCIRNSALAVIVCASVCLLWAKEMAYWIVLPLEVAWKRNGLGDLKMFADAVPDVFMVYLQLGLYAGFFAASPVVFHQIWKFISPGLYRRERRVALPFAVFSGLFFIGGGAFCYFLVLPKAFDFFLGYASEDIGYLPNIEKYLGLVTKMLLAFGVAFELPLLIFFLAYSGMVTPGKLWRFNKYFVPIAFFVAAILTPPDVYSQLLMAIPLVALYNLSILVSMIVRKKPSEMTLATVDDDDDAVK